MNVKNVVSKVGFSLKKNAPDILVYTGIAGFVTSTVLVGRASMKLEGHITELKSNLQVAEDSLVNGEALNYTEQDASKDRKLMYLQSSIKIAKLYALPTVIGGVSIGCVLQSHSILKNRMLSLSAAYATLAVGFTAYKERVAARYGEEAEREIRYNIGTHVTEETTTNSKGKEKTTTTETKVMEEDCIYSPYSKIFDESNVNWESDPEFSLSFLTAQQRYANDKLRATGHLFLNEVYDMLGFPRTKAGQVVGWIWDKNNNPDGDNFVDFGVFNTNKQKAIDFVNGYEPVIILDFNVDGNIWDKPFEKLG